jgi:hypothetical protein
LIFLILSEFLTMLKDLFLMGKFVDWMKRVVGLFEHVFGLIVGFLSNVEFLAV